LNSRHQHDKILDNSRKNSLDIIMEDFGGDMESSLRDEGVNKKPVE